MNLDTWNLVILAIAGYLAVMVLVRFMKRHHDMLTEDFRHRMSLLQRAEREKAQREAELRRQQELQELFLRNLSDQEESA